MANLQIRIDKALKEHAGQVAQEMGIDLSCAVRLFLTQMVWENGLPFRPMADPFFSERNRAALKKSIAELESGKVVGKSMDDLLRMEE